MFAYKKKIFTFNVTIILVNIMNLDRLVSLREDADLLQNDMGSILEVTQSNYSRWETGKEIIPLRKLNMLCNYFNVSADYILGLSKENKSTRKIELDPAEIGKRIRKVRNDSKVTQTELAELLNTSQSTVSAYESGKTLVLTAFAIEICKKYKVSLDYLMGRNKGLK